LLALYLLARRVLAPSLLARRVLVRGVPVRPLLARAAAGMELGDEETTSPRVPRAPGPGRGNGKRLAEVASVADAAQVTVAQLMRSAGAVLTFVCPDAGCAKKLKTTLTLSSHIKGCAARRRGRAGSFGRWLAAVQC
jgi:hypothetical protein